ncbi:MAG: hypothetical protein DI620_06145 [Haemophilus parainfluenzae]|jgi:ATP synthase F1, delta subunit|nr:MAG: hypothetical protein DI620_06145 [Haemophilus parainfluenzae]
MHPLSEARPYAQALFKLAKRKEQAENWGITLWSLGKWVKEKDVNIFLSSPKVSVNDKLSLLKDIANKNKKGNPEEIENFLLLLAQNHRLKLLPEISFLYKEFLNSEKGIVEGIIYTPYPVAKEILKQIITAIEKRYQIKLHAKNEVEPDLIGGFKVVFGDKVLDRSVKRELEELYRKMVS